jgi:hypothetical protein
MAQYDQLLGWALGGRAPVDGIQHRHVGISLYGRGQIKE